MPGRKDPNTKQLTAREVADGAKDFIGNTSIPAHGCPLYNEHLVTKLEIV
jgi:hypothetical protein